MKAFESWDVMACSKGYGVSIYWLGKNRVFKRKRWASLQQEFQFWWEKKEKFILQQAMKTQRGVEVQL